MKLYRYSKIILWALYIIILMIILNLFIFFVVEKGIISVESFIIIFGGIIHLTGIRIFIKNLSEDIYAKGHFTDFGQEKINFLINESDNENILPFTKIKVGGLDKNIEEYDEKGKRIKVYIRKDDDFNIVKGQISLIIGKWFLSGLHKDKLLDENALESLRIYIAKKMNYDRDILNEINEVIKNKENNKKFTNWLKKWGKIESIPNEIKPQKNILFEFIKPKFENIINDKIKREVKKKEEINFLIDSFCNENITILFIDDLVKLDARNWESLVDYYLQKANEILKNKKCIILASRGRNNHLNKKVANKLLKKQNLRMRYNFEEDKWIFKNSHIVKVNWRIIEKIKGT